MWFLFFTFPLFVVMLFVNDLDVSTDGKWCFILFWVVEGRVRASETRWGLLEKRLLEACPVASSASEIYNSCYRQQEIMAMEKQPQVYLLKFACYDRMGLLHGIPSLLCWLSFGWPMPFPLFL